MLARAPPRRPGAELKWMDVYTVIVVQTLLLLYTVPDVPTSHKHAITDVDAVLPPVLELAGHSEQFAVPTELLYCPAAHASHLSDSLLRMPM